MSTKSNVKKVAPAPARKPSIIKAAGAASTQPDKPKRPRKPRLPPIERAAKLGVQSGRKIGALIKNVGRWQGEVTIEQSAAVKRINVNLSETAPRIDELKADLAFLQDSGFAPKGGTPGRQPLKAGAQVKIKENRYEVGTHGENDFVVVQVTEKYIHVRHPNDMKAQPLPVPRAWLVVVDNDDDDDEAEILDDADIDVNA
jgi:hypothetical protein